MCVMQAAKAKVAQVLGLVAGTEAALVQVQSQVLALQQRLWEVNAWRPLLAAAWQLQEAEQWLAAELASLQQAEEQQQQQQQQPQGRAGVGSSDSGSESDSSSSGMDESVSSSEASSGAEWQESSGARDVQQQQQQQQQQGKGGSATADNSMLADLLGWAGPSAASAATAGKKAKVGRLLLQLADRQAELTRAQRHVQRLASILMAGVDDEVLGQVQRGIEGQLQQVERSRLGVRQQLQELTAAAEAQQ
jgi:hypothetical protein